MECVLHCEVNILIGEDERLLLDKEVLVSVGEPQLVGVTAQEDGLRKDGEAELRDLLLAKERVRCAVQKEAVPERPRAPVLKQHLYFNLKGQCNKIHLLGAETSLK